MFGVKRASGVGIPPCSFLNTVKVRTMRIKKRPTQAEVDKKIAARNKKMNAARLRHSKKKKPGSRFMRKYRQHLRGDNRMPQDNEFVNSVVDGAFEGDVVTMEEAGKELFDGFSL